MILPGICRVQENDKARLPRVRLMRVNGVAQGRQPLTIERARETSAKAGAANDLNRELLRAEAVNLRSVDRAARRQAQRAAS